MLDFTWQDLAAVATVVATIGYLARRVWLKLTARSKAGCGGCGGCPASSAATPHLVSLEFPSKQAK